LRAAWLLQAEEFQGSQGRAVAQKPAEGWSFVVHSMGAKTPKPGMPPVYVAEPSGHIRDLNDLEKQYLRHTDPTRRRKGVR
jgi:hypothetical protein